MTSENAPALQKFAVTRSGASGKEGAFVIESAGMSVKLAIDERDAREILEEILGFLGFPSDERSVDAQGAARSA